MSNRTASRVGIYAGTFDPVHAGHLAFALQAIEAAKLDAVYLMPERTPVRKPHVTHYAHRVAMISHATQPYLDIEVLETEDRAFSVVKTLPRLEARFSGAQLIFICGSDVLAYMHTWPRIEQLLMRAELCVGVRQGESRASVEKAIQDLPVKPLVVTVIDSYAAFVSSSTIRGAIRSHRYTSGLLQSVVVYAKREWLYV